MKLKLYAYLFLVGSSAILMASCKSATKLYEKGRYDEAVEVAAKKLQKDPTDTKLQDVILNAYKFAVEDHEAQLSKYNSSSNDLKWEWMYAEYSDLQRLYDAIRKSPDVYNIVQPHDYSQDVQQFREKAGDNRYNRGLQLMRDAGNDKLVYRQAYREFQTALGFIPGDVDIQNKMNEAFNYAVINVVVLPLEERGSYQYSSYNTRYRTFDNNMVTYLQNNNSNQFVRYYSAFDADARRIVADQVIEIRFSSMNIGRTSDERSTRTVSKDVVVKETVIRPDSVVKQYAKVTAKITTTKRAMRSNGMIQVVARDYNNRVTWSENYTGEHYWSTEFASYTGDTRALSEEDKKLVDRQQAIPPREDDIIRSIMDEIQSKAECGVRDYFNRF